MGRAIRIVVTGDVADWRIPDFSFQNIPEPLLGLIRSADLLVTNLEGPIRSGGRYSPPWLHPNAVLNLLLSGAVRVIGKRQPVVSSTPRILDLIGQGRHNCVCLANNHAGDLGARGIRDTRRILDERGLPCLGAGMNRRQANGHALLRVGGWPIAVLNYNYVGIRRGPLFLNVFGASGRSAGAAYLPRRGVRREIHALRQQVPGVWILLVVHAGRAQAGRSVAPEIDDAGVDDAAFERLGADCVIFHHSHAFLGTRSGRSFFLGDFVFAHPGSLPEDRLGGFVEITLDPRTGSYRHQFHLFRFAGGYPRLLKDGSSHHSTPPGPIRE